MEVLVAGAWFLCGALVYKFMSYALDLGTRALFAKEILFEALRLAIFMVEDVAAARLLKYTQMTDAGFSEEHIGLVKAADEMAIDNWKQTFINKVLTTFPKQYRGLISFDDWQGAMSTLDEEIKRSGKKWN